MSSSENSLTASSEIATTFFAGVKVIFVTCSVGGFIYFLYFLFLVVKTYFVEDDEDISKFQSIKNIENNFLFIQNKMKKNIMESSKSAQRKLRTIWQETSFICLHYILHKTRESFIKNNYRFEDDFKEFKKYKNNPKLFHTNTFITCV